ncbi:MAG TPA: cell envelope integrity protein TolA [Ramlibacter sp.]|nr:cell envelope integrity protein TolA [Ramlibacter sp.]
MSAVIDRLEFAPPPQPGRWRAFALAILAHLLLMLALTWGINWNRESENTAAEAELWASVPQQAAPREIQPPPAPPAPQPPAAPQVAPTPPPPPAPREADIALEREKLKQQQALQRQQELERQKALEARRKREELEREKKLEARKKQEDLKRQQLADKKAVEDKKKKDEQVKIAKTKQQQLQEDKRLAALHDEQMRRIQGLAGATGGPAATGAAPRAAGPSDSYAGRIRARVRPNIVFVDDIAGNPTAEVEVHMAPDGTITSRRLVKSSGVKSWDEAVLRAVDKTEVLPRDVDGRVHSPLLIEFRPKS